MPLSCHGAEPRLAAIQQLRNTVLVEPCLGDYEQATWEAALKQRRTVEPGEDGEAEVHLLNTQPGNVRN